MIGLFGQHIDDEKARSKNDYPLDIASFIRSQHRGCRYDTIRKKFSHLSALNVTRFLMQLEKLGEIEVIDRLYFYVRKDMR